MSEPKEDIDLLSQKELEDGEIEEELDDSEVVNTVHNEPVVINTDHDDSDVNITDKGYVKVKKHRHHKKSFHRKRHLNSEEKSESTWKKSKKSNDEDDGDVSDSKSNVNVENYQHRLESSNEGFVNNYNDNNAFSVSDNNNLTHKWGDFDSDDDNKTSDVNKTDNKPYLFGDSFKNKSKDVLSPIYEATCVDIRSPVAIETHEVSKWNYDSEDENEVTTSKFNNNNKTYDDNSQIKKTFKRWEPDHDKGWGNKIENNKDNLSFDNSPNKLNDDVIIVNSPNKTNDFAYNSPVREKNAWASCESPTQDCDDKKVESSGNSNKVDTNSCGKWNYDSDEEVSNLQNSPKRNDDSCKWGSMDSPKRNEEPQRWNSRDSPNRDDDESNKWNSRDSPKRNDDDSQRWGSRDGSRRNNFRRRGGRDGSRRNNFRRWGSRDGSQRGDNQRWGSFNDGENKRWGSSNNDGENKRWGSSNNEGENKRWGSSNNEGENKRWGSSNNEGKRWGSSNDNDNRKWGSYDNDNKKRGSNNGSPPRWGSSNNSSPQRNNDKRWGSNNPSPQRNNDDNQKWGSSNCSPSKSNEENKWASNDSPKLDDKPDVDVYDIPQKSKWGAYDSEDESKPIADENSNFKNENNGRKWNSSENSDQKRSVEDNKWDSGYSPPENNNNSEPTSKFGKWGNFDSDEETKPTADNSEWSNKSSWKNTDNDDQSLSTYNENSTGNRSKGNYNSGWNRNNDRNDYKNDYNERNKKFGNRNDNEKRSICKYYSKGSCRNMDKCNFLHESPNKTISQESKKNELCKFFEHQQCYKRATCGYMHEEFPCKLFHAGSKMCPSGDSCKYSHAPLTQETKVLLEKYLDEKVDERTEKNVPEWNSINKKSHDDDMDDDNTLTSFDPAEGAFTDPMRYRYPGSQDMMRFPVRPWNPMMRYNEMSMQVPHQMDFIHRQRFNVYDRFQYPMPSSRMFTRGFRGMVPPNMHEGFSNGMQYSIPPLMPGNPKLHSGNSSEMKDNYNMPDPFLDLAQLVAKKDPSSSPKRLVDMLDPNMQCEDIDDYSLDIESNNTKKNLSSPVVTKSPEVPPGAYVPRTSMNVVQPNVRLGPGPSFGGEQTLMYGGYPAHPSDPAMMDYINMSALHYFHNQTETMGYDVPWKLILLEFQPKKPYPLMDIVTQDLAHKYTDPRLKGHPSVLNPSNTNEEPMINQNSYDLNSISTFGSQLHSPNFISTCSESSETLTPLNDFLPKPDDPESPMFPINEEVFSFKSKSDTEDYNSKRVSDRSYLQDPRFKRKKVSVNIGSESSEME